MEVVPGVHRVDTPLGIRTNAVYLFVDDHIALYDTGTDGVLGPYVVSYLESIGREPGEVRHVVVSHCDVDHFGGIADAAELFPNAIRCAGSGDADQMEDYDVFLDRRGRSLVPDHGLDETPDGLEWLRSVTRVAPVDCRLIGGEKVRLGPDWMIEVLHVPGHSRGHLAIWDARSGSTVVSDSVMSDAIRSADGAPLFPPTYRYVADYRATLAAMQKRSPKWLLTAHYPVMERAASADFLAAGIEFVDLVEAAVLRAFRGPARSLVDSLGDLNAELATWPLDRTEGALALPVVGHLEDLRDRGVLRRIATTPSTWELVDA